MDISPQLLSIIKEGNTYVSLAIMSAALLDSLVFVGLFINGLALFTVSFALLTSGQASLWQIIFFAFIGALIGDQSGYAVGKIIGQRLFNHWPLKYKKSWYPKGTSFVEKYGIYSLLIGRFISPLRSLTPMICAILNMSYYKFLPANLLSCILWVIVWSAVLWLLASGYNILWIEISDLGASFYIKLLGSV